MDGIQLPQSYRATTRHFFTTLLPSILSFSKKLMPTIFQLSRIDSKFWCDVLRDLVPFAQFKKPENTHGGVLLLVKMQAFSLQLY